MTPTQQSAFLFLLGVQVLAVGLLTVVVTIVATIAARQQAMARKERSVMETVEQTVEQIDLTLDAIREAIGLVAKRQENMAATIQNLSDQLAGGTHVNQGQLESLLAEAKQALAMLAPLAGEVVPPPAITPSDPPPSSPADTGGATSGSGETPGAVETPATPAEEVPPPAVTPSEPPADAPAAPPA